MSISVYVGDTGPSVIDTLNEYKSNGSIGPINLTGATVSFRMRSLFGSTPLVDEVATISNMPGVDGKVRFDWTLQNTTVDILSSPGPYVAWWFIDYGGGSVVSTQEFPIEFLDHSPRRDTGPCTDWCSTQDVRDCYSDVAVGSCLTSSVQMASEVLFELTARQFPGWCQSVIRPCREGGACGACSQVLSRGHIVWGEFGWCDEGSLEPCGCGSFLQKIVLPGVAQHIVQVLINGQVVPDTAYRLDPDNVLLRIDGGAWPLCQNMALDGNAPGAFEITYAHGYSPPEVGRRAAAQLAYEFWKACSGGACRLPSGVVEIVRQGVRIKRAVSLFDAAGTGLPMVDAFLATFKAGPTLLVMSPEVLPTSRRTQ